MKELEEKQCALQVEYLQGITKEKQTQLDICIDEIKKLEAWIQKRQSLEEEAYEKIQMLETFLSLEAEVTKNLENGSKDNIGFELEKDIEVLTNIEAERGKLQETQQNMIMPSEEHFLHVQLLLSLLSLVGMILLHRSPFLFFIFLFIWGTSTYFYGHRRIQEWKKQKNKEKELQSLLHALHKIEMREKEVKEKWSAEGLSCLYKRLNELKQNQEEIKIEINSKRMEEIHQDVKNWLSRYLEVVPPFNPYHWMEEIRTIREQLRRQQNQLHQLRLKREHLATELHMFKHS
jgi:hypothetical protein